MVCCYRWHPIIWGGLLALSFSVCIKYYKKGARSLSWVSFLYVDIAQDSDLAPFLGDLSQSEKLSHLKPPLVDLLNSTSLLKLCRMKIFKYLIWKKCTSLEWLHSGFTTNIMSMMDTFALRLGWISYFVYVFRCQYGRLCTGSALALWWWLGFRSRYSFENMMYKLISSLPSQVRC